MRTCEFCRSEIPDNASFCGICGREVRSLPQSIRGNGNSVVPGQNSYWSGKQWACSRISRALASQTLPVFISTIPRSKAGGYTDGCLFTSGSCSRSNSANAIFQPSSNGKPRLSKISFCSTSAADVCAVIPSHQREDKRIHPNLNVGVKVV